MKADLRPPQHWDEATLRRNVLDHYPKEDVTASPVDNLSIMMHPIPKAWTLDGFSSGLNANLSQGDIDFIKVNYA